MLKGSRRGGVKGTVYTDRTVEAVGHNFLSILNLYIVIFSAIIL